MKILTIAIPSYNSMDYMRNCIESLLPGGEDVEILIVDDGSKDETPAIADEYEAKYPGIIRAIHQENGGHGEAVNAGLRNATGFFYKVVDSDDWVDAEAYQKILAFLKEAVKEEEPLDMLLSNYVYEKVGAKHKKVIQYHSILPDERRRDTGADRQGYMDDTGRKHRAGIRPFRAYHRGRRTGNCSRAARYDRCLRRRHSDVW